MEYSYKNSGVDVDLAGAIASKVGSNGAFAGMVAHPYLDEYYLCATTDGIGTKLTALLEEKEYKTIAIDLVAMNLNDLVCVGAFPVLFLDYIAVNSLDEKVLIGIINGLKYELSAFNCPLVGGEISEMPSIIKNIDVAGFGVGLVRKEKALGKFNVKKGDVVIGLESSGIHANGFTLVNKLVQDGKLDMKDVLTPTNLYVKEILELNKEGLINACANITGGGIIDNLCRVIPRGLCASLDKKALPKLDVFEKIKENVSEEEAFNVFNMGCGMCVVANNDNVQAIMNIMEEFNPFIFGEIVDEKNQTGGACFR